MTIKEAKTQIKNAMRAYFAKDETGQYEIPVPRQRPVFLIGPPGIGKTAIMEQIAQELDVALVSYSMTHHTRQSALGLPFITHKVYGGQEVDISEYTMSEIIASVYEMMEDTGKREGILFLDEINCVSETLSPIMLQFLQYKVFGRHKVPEGWIVVTAGNPPEYNNSVHEFDIVTWDRLKRIDVEPDFDCWKEYAYAAGVHPAVLTYLEIKKDHFYKVETTVSGKRFVTARGWDDLSQIIHVYEHLSIKVDESLISQYLQDPEYAKDFAIYYDLFCKYRSDYQVDSILDGTAAESIKERAGAAKFDEKLSLIGLVLDALTARLRDTMEAWDFATAYRDTLVALRDELTLAGDPAAALAHVIDNKSHELSQGQMAGSLGMSAQKLLRALVARLEGMRLAMSAADSAKAGFAIAKRDYDQYVRDLKTSAEAAGQNLTNVFSFFEEVFGEGQEMLILVTELTMNPHSSRFISAHGCEAYFKHNKGLLFNERLKEIDIALQELGTLDS